MADKNESVVIYQTWLESAALLGEEKQIEALMQIINYGIYGTVPDNPDDPMMQMLLMNWMPLVNCLIFQIVRRNIQKRKQNPNNTSVFKL